MVLVGRVVHQTAHHRTRVLEEFEAISSEEMRGFAHLELVLSREVLSGKVMPHALQISLETKECRRFLASGGACR